MQCTLPTAAPSTEFTPPSALLPTPPLPLLPTPPSAPPTHSTLCPSYPLHPLPLLPNVLWIVLVDTVVGEVHVLVVKVSVSTSVLHCGKANKSLLIKVYAQWIHRGHSHIQTTIKLQPCQGKWSLFFVRWVGEEHTHLLWTLPSMHNGFSMYRDTTTASPAGTCLGCTRECTRQKGRPQRRAANELTWFTRKIPLPREDATGFTIQTPPNFLKAAKRRRWINTI